MKRVSVREARTRIIILLMKNKDKKKRKSTRVGIMRRTEESRERTHTYTCTHSLSLTHTHTHTHTLSCGEGKNTHQDHLHHKCHDRSYLHLHLLPFLIPVIYPKIRCNLINQIPFQNAKWNTIQFYSVYYIFILNQFNTTYRFSLCLILFLILSYLSFYFILFYFISFYLIQFHITLSHPIKCYSTQHNSLDAILCHRTQSEIERFYMQSK